MSWNMTNFRRFFRPTRRQPIRNKPRFRPSLERLETRLAPANVPILSGHYDGLLSGWNGQETVLNPSNVNDAGFGKLFNYPVDGYTYAQPLYVPNLTIPGPGGGTYNVVFAATEHDTLYAFNADAKTGGPNNDGVLWKHSFIDPANGITTMPSGETFSGDIVPEIGITGTPVIDPATNTLYVIAKTKEIRAADPLNAHYVQKLYAIDITTGNLRASNSSTTIGDSAYVNGTNNFVSDTTPISVPGTGAGSDNGTLRFNARKENDRMSLQIVNGTVYLAYASHGDNGPYHGWIIGYDSATLGLKKVFNTSPNGSASGIWESGGNLGFDAQGNLYFATGNGFGTGYNLNKGGPTALGDGGGALGYSGGAKILNSVSVRFRNFPTNTGLGTNGDFGADVALPGFDFNAAAQAGDTFTVNLSYNAGTKVLTETITNNNHPTQTFTTNYNIDIPATIGGSTAYVGFTGGTGGLNAEQDIKTWVFTPTSGAAVNHGSGFASSADLTANGGASLPPYTAADPIGVFNYHQDLGVPGDPTPAGTAMFNSSTGTYTLTASGTDIGFKSTQYDTDTDRMQFVYNPVTLSATTDTDIQVRVASLTNTDFWTKAAIMIRQSLDPQADNVASIMSPHNVSEMTWRNNPPTIDNAGNQSPGLTGAQERPTGTGPLPGWLRLVHVHGSNTFKAFWATDNNGTPGAWQGEIDHDVAMTGEVYLGIGLSAHANGKTATATFDHLTITGATTRTQDPNAVLTPAANGQASSIFANNKVDVSGNWSTSFVFRMLAGSNPVADGMTFTVQNAAAGTEASESTLKLSTTGPGTSLPITDYFTPHDWKLLDNQDADLGSGGTLLLPDAVGSAAHPHLMVETGKTGRLYLIDRDNMGKFNTRYDHIVQIIAQGGTSQTPGVWGNPAFFQDGPNTGLLYYWGSSAPGLAYRITNGVMTAIPVSVTTSDGTHTLTFGFPGAQPSISSNGTNGATGIMWAIRDDNFGSTGPESLYAFNAENLAAGPIWVSNDVAGRDAVGGTSVKFVFPIVTNGHVYVGSAGSLAVYGLLPAHTVAPGTPTGFTVSQLAADQGGDTHLKLSWTLADNNATLIKIERSTSATGPFTQIAEIGGDQTMFTDSGLVPLTHYFYRIRATNQAGDSAYTAVADNTTRLPAPKLSVTNTSSLEVDLSWTAVISGAAGNFYEVQRSTDGGATYTTIATNLPSTQTTYADKTVTEGNTYTYRIHAHSANPPDDSFSNTASFVDKPVDIEDAFPSPMIANADGLQFNGSAFFSPDEHLIRLNNDFGQSGTVFTTNRVDTTHFSTTFWMRLHEGTQPNPADGYTFIIQGSSPAAIGAGGGGLGYQNIATNSIAVKFDVFNNEGETDNSTGVFVNGHFPGVSHGPLDVNVPINKALVNIGDQHRKRIDINYDVTTQILDLTITDEQHDGGPTSFHTTFTIDIPSVVGSGGGYVGFGGGTGGLYSLQDVLGWVFPATAPAGVDNLQAKVNTGTINSVDLTWTDHAVGETGYNVERSIDNYHFFNIATLGVGANSFHDDNGGAGLNNNTVYFYRVQAFNDNGGSAYAKVSATVGGTFVTIDHSAGFASHNDLQANGNAKFQDPAPAAGTIGIFTAHQDVGTAGDPGTPGTATFDGSTAKYVLSASGSDIWDTADHMQYLYKPMSGDGEIIARVVNVDNTDYWSKGGLMIRTDTSAGAQDAFMLETGGNAPNAHNEPVFQWRTGAGGGTSDSGNHPGGDVGIKAPIWLRLVRSGNSFSGYWATDIGNGQSHGSWQDLGGTQTVAMPANVLVGLALTAHNNGTTAHATFDHVSVVTSALLVDGGGGEAGSIFTTAKEPITGSFTTSFVMNARPVSGSADGLDFVIQNDGAGSHALGAAGGGQGYNGITPSIAIKFNLYSQGSHKSTTGLYTNGGDVGSTTGQIDMSGAGIDFTQNHTYQVDIAYDGFAVLTETVKDLVSGKVFSTSYSINVRDTIGSDSAYVGFTGGTGGETAWLAVESWTATFNTTTVPPHLEDNFPLAARSGSPYVFTVAEKNQNGTVIGGFRGTIHFSSSDPQAILPGDANHNYTFTAADNGQHQFAAVLFNVGPQSITVTEVGSVAPLTDERDVTVTPASFDVTGFPSEVTAGDPHNVTVVARDFFGNVATGYTGTVHFSSTDANAILPPNSTLSGGTGTFSVTLVTAGTQSITVNDTLTPDSKGTEDGIQVDPAAVSTFIVTGFPSTTQAGVPHDFTVTAKDAFGNTATNYNGTVSFTSDDPNASLPGDSTLTNGVGTFSATLVTAGTRHVTVSDNAAGVQVTSGDILVTPGAAVGFQVMVLGEVLAGTPVDVFVTAVDAYGNTGAVYTGTVHFTSSDGAASLPPDYKFTTGAGGDNGSHVFSGVIFRTRGHQSVTVTDTLDGTITGSNDFDVM